MTATPDNILGTFEEFILLAILGLKDRAYGGSIQRHFQEVIDLKRSIGAIHLTLSRLEEKGYARPRRAKDRSGRSTKKIRYFRVARSGIEALRYKHQILARLWSPALDAHAPENLDGKIMAQQTLKLELVVKDEKGEVLAVREVDYIDEYDMRAPHTMRRIGREAQSAVSAAREKIKETSRDLS